MDDFASRSDGSLYEHDFYSWTQRQAELLREGRLDGLDSQNIAEELETLGRSELGALVSAYRLVAQHLLKLMMQPDRATDSWEKAIERERGRIADVIEDNPGLASKRDEAFAKGFARSRREAAIETKIEIDRFPKDPPFSREQAETDFWPQGFSRRRPPDVQTGRRARS